MAQTITLFVGVSMMFIGLSFVLRANEWKKWLLTMEKSGANAGLAVGVISTLFGALILAFHPPVWAGKGVVLTLVGVLSLIKGIFYLLYPAMLVKVLQRFKPIMKPWLIIGGLVWMGIALFLLVCWRCYLAG